MDRAGIRIHETTDVSHRAIIGEGSQIWNFAQVREDATIGNHCVIGKEVYVDFGVRIGDCVKIQNHVSVFHGVMITSGVFVGPHVCFTNDRFSRAVSPDGVIKDSNDWTLVETMVERGASIGASSTIMCGVTIGKWAVVGAGSVVTHDVLDHALVFGNPARVRGAVCRCGTPLKVTSDTNMQDAIARELVCSRCGERGVHPMPFRKKIDDGLWEVLG